MRTHSRLMRDELGESFDHLRMAAAHAADGASGALAPRVDAARKAVRPGVRKARDAAMGGMDTVLVIARDRSREAGKKAGKMGRKGKARMMGNEGRSSRWPMAIGGILVAGAAVGAASAMLRRRRNQQSWDEYGSTRTTSDTGSMLDSAKSSMDAGIEKAKTMGEAAKDRASDLIGSKSTNTGPAGSGEYDKPSMPQSASKNSRP
ncbi:hypothetical protein ACFFX1_25295 [Dactylosporangium sucinum]|uniref:hypothetical protein n=1 Tax=Dactylosporangium sucinum TaxID=1424081 RepID=UPI00167C5AC5|nr:hypothetical protein [Dactylosporangium sucinum]